ncbi:MAG: zinc ribbon domain-containing protein [Caldilineaceae bacterium]|nr:zinc ribbon domain-containing protein [Caldilineaceae bacterium]
MSSDLINSIATVVGVVVAVLGAFLFAFWIAMGIWTFNDIRARSRDWLAILLACVLVLIFPIVGLILYLMIRPKHTLAEVYDRALEEEALLREIEETLACATCGVPVKEVWVYCPTCHQQLQHACVNCKQLVRNEWEICVYCGTAQQAAAPSFMTPPPQVVANPSTARPNNNNLFNRRPNATPTNDVDVEESFYRPASVSE